VRILLEKRALLYRNCPAAFPRECDIQRLDAKVNALLVTHTAVPTAATACGGQAAPDPHRRKLLSPRSALRQLGGKRLLRGRRSAAALAGVPGAADVAPDELDAAERLVRAPAGLYFTLPSDTAKRTFSELAFPQNTAGSELLLRRGRDERQRRAAPRRRRQWRRPPRSCARRTSGKAD